MDHRKSVGISTKNSQVHQKMPTEMNPLKTVGKLMGGVWVEGLIARSMYRSLYKMHQIALHGVPTVLLDTLASSITRRTEPHVKLH